MTNVHIIVKGFFKGYQKPIESSGIWEDCDVIISKQVNQTTNTPILLLKVYIAPSCQWWSIDDQRLDY
jgi:hypothetical protein